ncbi:MAG: hypothetical protein ACLPTZ_00955 [Beijerinckiaceae bacterium]
MEVSNTTSPARNQLEILLLALDASPLAMRLDDCRDWTIAGKLGHVYTDGAGYLLCVDGTSRRRWTNLKCRLRFCRVAQDGDDEGCLHLDRLPTPTEAVLIRKALGIRRRLHPSPEVLATLKANRARAERPPGGRRLVFQATGHPEPSLPDDSVFREIGPSVREERRS